MEAAKRDIFPLDERWQLAREGFSTELSKQIVWLSGLMTFAQVSEVLQQVGQVYVPATTVWEQVNWHGQRLQDSVQRQREQVSVERTRWEQRHYDAHLYRSIALDGGMVHLRGEGWKEMKVGMVSGVTHDWQTGEATVRLVEMDYCGVIGDVQAFSPALWALAVQHAVPYAGHSAVTADGSAWIWRLTSDLFPCSVQIVDWYHARQHLAQAATCRYPDDEDAAQDWLESMSAHLFRGEIFRIVSDLHQHGCAPQAAYFVTHQRRMQYAAFRADGYPIGSGGVESAVKQFKQRLTGAGMRWSRAGAERMVCIRSAVLTHSLEVLWQSAA